MLTPFQGCSLLPLCPLLSRQNHIPPPCSGISLEGIWSDGPPLLVLKSLPDFYFFNEVLISQVPHQPCFPSNLFTDIIRDYGQLGTGVVDWSLLLRGSVISFPCAPYFSVQGLEHFRGCLGWHSEQALHSPTTPSAAVTFLFGGCRYTCRFRSGERALGWCCHPPWVVGVAPSAGLLGGRHKEDRSRGTGHDLTSLKQRKGEGWIAADVVLNIGTLKPPVAPEWF